MKILLMALALPAFLFPLACLVYIVSHAWDSLTWSLIFGAEQASSMIEAGQSLWPQIVGSLSLMVWACVLALPVAVSLALFHALYATARQRRVLTMGLQLLQGIPPIVYGLCGLLVLVHGLHWGISLAAGGVILAVIILPLLSSNMMHALERIPVEQTESAKALGLSSLQIIGRVWLPLAWSGFLTGLLLAMARALSETAPILFTATVFSGVDWPDSMFSPVTSLQTHIFYLAQEGSDAHAVGVAWASAAILLALILCFSLAALALRRLEAKV